MATTEPEPSWESSQPDREPCGCNGQPHWYNPATCRARRAEWKG